MHWEPGQAQPGQLAQGRGQHKISVTSMGGSVSIESVEQAVCCHGEQQQDVMFAKEDRGTLTLSSCSACPAPSHRQLASASACYLWKLDPSLGALYWVSAAHYCCNVEMGSNKQRQEAGHRHEVR